MLACLAMAGRWLSGVVVIVLLLTTTVFAQQAGSIRGMVYDNDFNVPLAAAQVSIAETGEKTASTDQGNFVFPQMPPGKYTLVFSKEGYTRQVQSNVVVSSGQLTDVDSSLSGEFTEMEEFVVQDLRMAGTEAGLLMLRVESPALLDSISSELISKAGAGDAASALKFVAGTTVQDGKYAVVHGLPDRYVNSQMNTVRLPTADEDKRAVQLDQFPSEVIESIQVSKTFTPDQQGDASGGAVNVVLKGIPDDKVLKLKFGTGYNTQVTANSKNFLTYKGGGVQFWDKRDGGRGFYDRFFGAVGVDRGYAPLPYNASLAAGGNHVINDLIKVGGFASVYYKRESSYYDSGVNDGYWIENPGEQMTPRYEQGTPDPGGMGGDFKTSLFDVTQGAEEVQGGGMATVGVEIEDHSLDVLYLYTQVIEDKATLSEDVRGKQYYFPEYNVNNPTDPGNLNEDTAPYLRTETLQYTVRTTDTAQVKGKHKLPLPDMRISGLFDIRPLEIDWTLAQSSSFLYQPDKRQFGSLWTAPSLIHPAFPSLGSDMAEHLPFKPAANFTVGNLQRIWKEISEESQQYFINGKFPFEQWSGGEGYLKLGVFHDEAGRQYHQESFSNFDDNTSFNGDFKQFWSEVFTSELHPTTEAFIDVDYRGKQQISSWYYMADLPLCSFLKVIGGIRYERTDLRITNDAEKNVNWVPPGVGLASPTKLNPGDADVSFDQEDSLPSLGLAITPVEKTTLRVSYSETVARQTFKELSPIEQQEYLGADIFIGNPDLKMSALTNYDVRLDYAPYSGGLFSFSWFRKDIVDPIEYIQRRTSSYGFTTPVNYPSGKIIGYEFEGRQNIGHFWEGLRGLSLGGNVTFLDSMVLLPGKEAALFEVPNIMVSMKRRDMSHTPERLYNIFLTYELERLGTDFGIFYSVKGDTLVVGAGQDVNNFLPSVYEKEYGTLNFTLSQKVGKYGTLVFQVKNLTNPRIQEVYRSEVLLDDITKTSYKKGIDYSLSIGVAW